MFHIEDPKATPEEREAAEVAARLLGEDYGVLTLDMMQAALDKVMKGGETPEHIVMSYDMRRQFLKLLDEDKRTVYYFLVLWRLGLAEEPLGNFFEVATFDGFRAQWIPGLAYSPPSSIS